MNFFSPSKGYIGSVIDGLAFNKLPILEGVDETDERLVLP